MTRTGRPRTPTATKELEGTFRKDRANPDEPRPDLLGADDPPPDWLKSKHARAGWAEALPVLVEMGLATKADRIGIAMLCEAFGRWVSARDPVRREIAFNQVKAMLVEYGLTAQSRSKVHGKPAAGEEQAADPNAPPTLAELMKRRKTGTG